MRFVEGREPFLRRLRVRGLLSFGPDTPDFEFSPLDVLIGANAQVEHPRSDPVGGSTILPPPYTVPVVEQARAGRRRP